MKVYESHTGGNTEHIVSLKATLQTILSHDLSQ